MGASSSSSIVTPATDRDFEHVHRIPANIMVDSLKPCTKPGQTYELQMKTNPRGRISYANKDHSSSLRSLDEMDASTTSTGQIVFPLKIKGGSSKLLLQDRTTQKVRATMHREGSTFQVYCSTPCHAGQEQEETSSSHHCPGQKRYPWAEIKFKPKQQRYQMKVFDNPKSPTVYSAQTTYRGKGMVVERGNLPCGNITRGKNQDGSYGRDPFWSIQIGPGIDPSLFLCFVAVLDEMIMTSQ